MTMQAWRLLKPVPGSENLRWTQRNIWGRLVSQSGGLLDSDAVEVGVGDIVLENVPRGTASKGDVVVVYDQHYRVEGIEGRPETNGARVKLNCALQTRGSFTVPARVTLGGRQVTLGGERIVL